MGKLEYIHMHKFFFHQIVRTKNPHPIYVFVMAARKLSRISLGPSVFTPHSNDTTVILKCMSHKVISELGQVLMINKQKKTKTEHADLQGGNDVKFESSYCIPESPQSG